MKTNLNEIKNENANLNSLFNHPTLGSCKVILNDGDRCVVRNIFSDREYAVSTEQVIDLQRNAEVNAWMS